MKYGEKKSYEKPELEKLENIKHITFDCPEFACSIEVPPPPTP